MPRGAFDNIEAVPANGFDAAVRHWCNTFGTEIKVYKKTETEYDRVYGVAEGVETDSSLIIVGVITNYETVPYDDAQVGEFEEGYLYTVDHDKVKAGDELEIVRDKQIGLNKRFTAVAPEQAGQTQRAFRRWQISSVGE